MSLRQRAIVVLLLLVPAPTIGVLFAMVIFPDTPAGVALFGASKLWLFGLPVVWHKLADRATFSFAPPKHGWFVAGILSGALLSAIILAMYWSVGDALIDRRLLIDKLTAIGLGSPCRYACGALYWILVNSVLEEYVWRWFCVKQCEQLLSKRPAIVCSAFFFTLHHVAAMAVYFGPIALSVSGIGVFACGALWSMIYIRYRSIWPGYVSHAIVDLCIFAIGATILFGAR